MRKAVIYARVSSTGDRQDTERQVEDLKRYATAADLDIVEVYTEKASGAKDDREILAECIEALRQAKPTRCCCPSFHALDAASGKSLM